MDQDIFISEIKINRLRHLHDITIPIVKEGGKLKHLILTGKNGSGKTLLLNSISRLLEFDNYSWLINNNPDFSKSNHLSNKKDNDLELFFNTQNIKIHQEYVHGYFFAAFLKAKRSFHVSIPNTVEIVEIPDHSSLKTQVNESFLKYLVFLRFKLTDAAYRKDSIEVEKLEKWFKNFEQTLKEIFKDNTLQLVYDSNDLNFEIINNTNYNFGFNTLSDGYASFINILTELMMRMERNKTLSYDINGIVLIDEIETHLHIELQKSILPFLTAFFPKVQFIVTTHSPFILNSIENAVVYDLENHILFEDASEISYSGLIEKYFLTSQYSDLMERKIAQFESLVGSSNRTEAEDEKLADLLVDLKTLSPLLSPEMYNRFHLAQKKILKPAPARA